VPVRSYSGKNVVITGAAGGMGRAFAQRFARAGARLALLDLDGEAVNEHAGELNAQGHAAVGLACDVSDEASCKSAMEQAISFLGGVDVLVNNAGITHRSAFAETEAGVFRRVMGVNFFGSLYCTQAALPSLIRLKGQIIVISSIAGFAPLLGRTGYSASKHALHGLFDSLRTELIDDSVDVLIVCPGFTRTGITTAALDGDGSATKHPQATMGRISEPDEVAEAVFKAAQKNQRLLVLSPVGKLTRAITRVAPGLYEKLMARSMKKELER
jgi:NAD(P)-dependent dehydrogenase (short-subunit alcohol dehydrogenase family)